MEASGNASQSIFYKIIDHLDNYDCGKIKELMQCDRTSSYLKDIAWDLVPKVSSYITQENVDKAEFLECCEDILLRLCKVGNVKEILLVLLEQIEGGIDSLQFVTLLSPIQKCLLSLPSKRGHSLMVTLETFMGYLTTLPLPDMHQLEEEERRLLDSDSDVRTIVHVIREVLLFLEPLISSCESKAQKREITKFLIRILDHPLGHMDLQLSDSNDQSVSSCRIVAERLIAVISSLESDFSATLRSIIIDNEKLMYMHSMNKMQSNSLEENLDDLVVEEPVQTLGLAVFAFLVITDTSHQRWKPQVLTVIHWLDLTKDLIQFMIKHNNILIRMKAVSLLNTLLETCDVIQSEYFDWNVLKTLIDNIIIIMCSSQNKGLAQAAVKSFTILYKSSEIQRRHKLMYYLLTKLNHSGVIGYVIGLLKDDINANLNYKPTTRNLTFSSSKLAPILKCVFTLPENEKTDLLEQSERILGSLNLLRFLILKDKPHVNETGIWSIIQWIESNFNKQLHLGINMSRAHYQLDIDNLLNNKKGKNDLEEDNMDFTISGQSMPGLSKEQKLHVLQMAVQRFDMIESVLCRVRELVDQVQKENPKVA